MLCKIQQTGITTAVFVTELLPYFQYSYNTFCHYPAIISDNIH